MTKSCLGIKLDEKFQSSDWNKPTLTKRQIDYAASDVRAGIELFLYFAERIDRQGFFESTTDYAKRIVFEHLSTLLDKHYPE